MLAPHETPSNDSRPPCYLSFVWVSSAKNQGSRERRTPHSADTVSAMADATESPIPIALLVADHVYLDRDTHKFVIAGTFTNIHTGQVPCRWPCMAIYFQVTNISKPVDFRVRITRAADQETLFEFGGPIKAASPLSVVENHVVLNNFVFPSDGKYWVELVSREEILIAAPLYVILLDKAPGEGS